MPAVEADMSGQKSTVNPRTSWYRRILSVALVALMSPYILLVLAIFLILGLYSSIHIATFELLLYLRMRHCGRFLRWRRLSAHIANEGGGTLIIESPSLGWGFTHAWWTPDKVMAVSPYPTPTEDDYRRSAETGQCLDWDRWHWDNYTDPQKGRALLLRVLNGRSLEKWVKRDLPSVDVVHTWTAFVHARKSVAERGGA